LHCDNYGNETHPRNKAQEDPLCVACYHFNRWVFNEAICEDELRDVPVGGCMILDLILVKGVGCSGRQVARRKNVGVER
jgi:hypothetical protein